jgi:hypothetical protein
MTNNEQIIALTIEQANLVLPPERKISIVFGYSNREETLQKTDPVFAREVEGSALMQYKGVDFGLLFGGPQEYLQIMVWHQLRPALIIQGPHHWEVVALLSCDFESPDPPMVIPAVRGGAVQALSYLHFPLDGFKWWFVSAICDKLLSARERLLGQWADDRGTN